MTLRKKTLLIIGVTLVSMMVALYIIFSNILLSNLAKLEEEATRHVVKQALDAIYNDINNLELKVADWAVWDDTYRFIEDANDAYVKSNLADSSFTEPRINLMLFIHSSGRMVFGKGFDLKDMKATPIPENLKKHLSAGDLLLQHPDTKSWRTGIVLLPEAPMLIASRPILTSEGKGPIRGTVIFGRYLDADEIKRLAQITHLSLTVHRFEDTQMTLDFQAARSSLSEKTPIFVRPLNADFIAGYSLLRDIYGKPALLLRVDIPRTFYQHGQSTMHYFIFSLLAVGLVFGVATLLFLEKGILSRLAHLCTDVSKIGRDGKFSARLLITGSDELSILSGTINEMLEALEHSQHELRRAHDELEVRIQGRTAELLKANEALQAEIAERKQREQEMEAILKVSFALRTAHTRIGIQTVILDQLIYLLKAEGASLAMHDHISGKTVIELAKGKWTGWTGLRLAPGKGICGHVIETGQPFINNDVLSDPRFASPDLIGGLRAVACTPLIAQEQAIGALWIGRKTDITDHEVRLLTAISDIAANAIYRAILLEQTEQRLRRISALHTVDVAISASLDLRVTLNILLDQVTTHLQADAAALLLLNPYTQTLTYTAGRGFCSKAIQQTKLLLGEGHAGRAALTRQIVSIPDVLETTDTCVRKQLLEVDRFIAHHAVPLIAKGQVKGVLEIFHRTSFVPDSEWLDFLETLAGQAAIAIDNTELFNNLQRSNIELSLAYDTTLEGWARALDCRDKETEGHSRRVTEITVKIAQDMGVSEAELVHIRRGALLHDIGKLGVPDAVLFNPGKLNNEEWEIMKRHPVLAYELLSPIAFLRPALDIPYCHHEKWDGTGYPHGLKGKQIPLPARIFAVADIWDALNSKRPYRPAWPEEKVQEYLREQTGKHFDPKVVEVFLKLLSEQKL